MNSKFKNMINNFSFVMGSQVYSILISTITVFIMPRYFSSEAYSYYQLENLYCSYIWIISLGIHTGFFLKYAGKKKSELDKSKISSQVTLYIVYILLVSVMLIILAMIFEHNINKRIVLIMSIAIVLLEIITNTLTSLLQAINYMKQYSITIVFLRTLSLVFLVIGIVLKIKDFRFLIFQDLFSKVITIAFALFLTRDMLFGKIKNLTEAYQELKKMFHMGINIMLSSYVGKLVNGITQYMIEGIWGILVFGKIALCFSISSIFSKFFSAMGTVLLPILKRIDTKKYGQVYDTLNILSTTVMLFLFCFYMPGICSLKLILPAYADSMDFVAILLPTCLYEMKETILINTYLQILHKEQEILYSNVISVLISLISSIVIWSVARNLFIAVISIDIVMAFRCWYIERRLHVYMPEIRMKNVDLWVMSALFIFCNWHVGEGDGAILFIFAFVLYIILKRQRLIWAGRFVYEIAKKK